MSGKSKKIGKNKSGRRSKRTKRRTARRSKRRTARRTTRRMRGGMTPLVGAPYNAAERVPDGNYLAYNPKVQAWPEQSNAILQERSMMGLVRAGGGKGKRGGKKQRGGGLNQFMSAIVPQDILNIGRSLPAAAGHMYDKFNGSLSPASSLVYPTQQPLVSPSTTSAMLGPPGYYAKPQTDILQMYNNNNNLVSKM